MQLLSLLLPLFLGACADREMSDLVLYIQQVKARPASGIDPLPEPASIQAHTYPADDRRDPFAARFAQPEMPAKAANQVRKTAQPDLQRRRETLENYPLDSLRMVGTLGRDGANWALVRSQDGVIHRVAVGNYMGQQHGRIVQIQETRITLLEWVPSADGLRQKRVAVGLENRP